MTETTDIGEIHREMRRVQNNLTSIGTGVVFFAFWIVIKMIGFLYLYRDDILNDPDIQEIGTDLYYFVFALFILFNWGVHIYIGISARAEGKGRQRKLPYMAALTVWIFLYLVAFIFDISGGLVSDTDLFDAIANALIDITMVIMLSELIISTVKIRALRRQAVGG
ncbi:MAG: hypothetical protein IJ827_07020 [Lachnospiraceae bacterium]|nr:hypothetical protein [Lachnospiraceae bacterium]